jgi:uncharacterized membrane protein HdeD (DUF308 family)
VIVTNPFSSGSLTPEQIDNVSRGWWVLLLSGIISAIAGGVILFTSWTVGDLVVFVGLLFVFRGIFMTLSVPVDGATRGWSVVLGLLEVGVGVAVWSWPGPTLLVLAGLIGWWVLFSGVMTTAGAIRGRDVLPYWGLTLVFGLFETFFSFWLFARPDLTLVAAVMAIGLWTMLYGVVQVVLSFEVKNLPRRAAGVVGDIKAMAA